MRTGHAATVASTGTGEVSAQGECDRDAKDGIVHLGREVPMNLAVFSPKPYDIQCFNTANERHGFELSFLEPRLTRDTVALAEDFPVICPFVNDQLDAEVLRALHAGGTRLLALRSAGYNHVDLAEAARLGLVVTRVPAYSPYAVAEHTLALMLTLNRKTHRAYARVRDGNFALDGLMGFDMHGRTAGIVGTGKIGALVVRSLLVLGCQVLASKR
jgi:D-lactate dehydrogenase